MLLLYCCNLGGAGAKKTHIFVVWSEQYEQNQIESSAGR